MTGTTAPQRPPYTLDPEALRAELAPRGPLESLLVAEMIWAAAQLDRLMKVAPDQADRDWHRRFSSADRTFHRNLSLLSRRRRQTAPRVTDLGVTRALQALATLPKATHSTLPNPVQAPLSRPTPPPPTTVRYDRPAKGRALLESSLGSAGPSDAALASFSVGLAT